MANEGGGSFWVVVRGVVWRDGRGWWLGELAKLIIPFKS